MTINGKKSVSFVYQIDGDLYSDWDYACFVAKTRGLSSSQVQPKIVYHLTIPAETKKHERENETNHDSTSFRACYDYR